jgi:hypothetical protein
VLLLLLPLLLLLQATNLWCVQVSCARLAGCVITTRTIGVLQYGTAQHSSQASATNTS